MMSSPRERSPMAFPNDEALLQKLRTAWDDLAQLVDWWHARKAFFERAEDPVWETELHSYHIARRYIDLIRQQAEVECTSQKEIINRALGQFFAGSETAADGHS